MPAISVGSVEVDVVPNARGIQSRLRAALVPHASTIGDEVGRIIGQRIAANIGPAVRDGIQDGARAARPAATRGGEQAGGAFARSLRARLEAAFRSMPRLDVRLSDTGVDADLARLRARLESLAGKTIGIDIDAATARAQAADIEERLRRIGAAHPNVAVRADTAAAIAQLQLLQQQIDETTRDPARIRVETDGTFGQRLRAQVQAAEASLPNINLTADSSAAEVEIARLRAQLTALRDVRIGVDMDAATATARIEAIQARLQVLSASDADIAIRVDTGAAAAQLAAVQAMVSGLDGRTANVNVRVSGMQLLITSAIALGPALLPVLPVAAAGLGAIAAAATAAAVGIGGIAAVAAPAFMQIGKVLQAQKAAQDAATQATMQGGQASSQAAQKALQMASAQQSLAAAHRNAARQIRQAEEGVADAVRNAAEANERAAQQVKQAKRGLADAVQQAADRQRSAAEQVRSAEESLADAQRTARQAQQDLTQARADAARQLEDLESRLANASLSERDAVLAVQEAHTRLIRMREAGESASYVEQQRAQLAYDQAVQRLADQRAETKRLSAEKKKADKAGVEGSDLVLDAQERLRQAEQGVAKGQQQLAKAREDAARQAVQSQRDIAEAQQRVAEAQRNVTRTQEDGARSVARAQEQLAQAQQSTADSIASAQRQIASASLSAAGGVDQAALAQQKYQAELAKLTPAARETMAAYTGLRDAFGAWSKSLQPAVMPIFTRALNGMKNALPGLTPFVLEAADAIKGLQDRASAGFKSPWWKEFKQDLEGSIKPAIEGLGVGFGNLFKGMAGVVQAFMPHMDSISERMQRITGRFADWGTGLKGSPEFEQFLDYSSDMAPVLAETFGDIGRALFDIGQALKPVSKPVLELIGAFASGLSDIATYLPEVVIGLWGLLVVTRLWRIAQLLMNGAMVAFNIISKAGPWGWLILGITAVVLAVIYMYRRFAWFRNAVKAVWEGIKKAASVVKDWFSGPFARFWTQALPGFFKAGWNLIKAWVLYPVRNFFTKTVPGWARTLRDKVVGAWTSLREGVADGWEKIKRNILNPIKTFFTSTVPGWGTTLKNKFVSAFDEARKGIKTAWDKIRDITKKPVAFVVNTVYNDGIRKVWNLVTDAFGGKHLAAIKGFATGGIMPGYTPGRDVHLVPSVSGPVALSGGEAIMRPEWTRAVGSGYVHSMNAAARQGGVSGVRSLLGFKDGGIFSGIGDALSDGWDKVKKGASWLKDTFGSAIQAGVKTVVNPVIKKIPGAGKYGNLLKDLMKAAVKRLISGGKEGDKRATPQISYSPTKGVEQWRPVVLQSLREVGQPAGHANRTLRRMQQESGGNPKAVNLWDINAKRGHPSVGLMQVIGPTFRAYAGKYRNKGPFMYGTSIDPLANIYSSMKYALSTYGSLPRAYDRPGGYDSGGYLQPGLNLAYNGTGRPEPVFTRQQASALFSLSAKATTGGGLQPGDQLALRVADHEFTAYVEGVADGRVKAGKQQLIQVLNAG